MLARFRVSRFVGFKARDVAKLRVLGLISFSLKALWLGFGGVMNGACREKDVIARPSGSQFSTLLISSFIR